MTDLTPVAVLSPVVQLETTDRALGGTGNPMNRQAQALLNRDAFRAQQISNNAAGATAYTDALRQDLADDTDPAKGADLIGFSGGTVRDKLIELTGVDVDVTGAVDATAIIQAAISTNGAGNAVALQLPAGAAVKILGTVYIPPLCDFNLNGSVITGSGTNTMFESGMWSAGVIVSNFGSAPETEIVYSSAVYNANITNCSRAFKLFNFAEDSRVHGIRFSSVDQALYAERCFYGSFTDMIARAPLNPASFPAYHMNGAVNAVEYRGMYAVGYNLGHLISGTKDTFRASNCGAEGGVDGIRFEGETYGADLQFWYLENNTGVGIDFSDLSNHENAYVDHCFVNTTPVFVRGGTIISGEIGQNNKFLTSSDIQVGTNFSSRLKVHIPTDISADNAVPSVPSSYIMGDACLTDYVKTIYNSGSGLVAFKGAVHAGIIPLEYSGTAGEFISNIVPFSVHSKTAGTTFDVLVDTKINYRSTEMLGYFLQVVDETGSYNVQGFVMGLVVGPIGGGKTVTVENNAGFIRLRITSFSHAESTYTCTGVIRHL